MDRRQAVQKGRSARPQASRNRRRTLRGTLRISMSRERSWRTLSTACLEVHPELRISPILIGLGAQVLLDIGAGEEVPIAGLEG